MKPVVYVDVLFLLNFVINFLLLLTTKKVCKSAAKTWRLSLGALAGSIYAVLMFFPSLAIYYTLLAKLVFSAALIAISFPIKRWREFGRIILVFYAVNFSFAGAAFGLFYLTDFGSTIGAVMSNGIFYFDLPLGMLLITSLGAYLLIWVVQRIYAYKMSKAGTYYDIVIHYHGKQTLIHALLDTGNSLTDPLTGKPVIVAELNSLKVLFDDTVNDIFLKFQSDDMKLIPFMMEHMQAHDNFRLIPFSSLGKENGLLLAFVPDAVELVTEGKNITDVLIGVYTKNLSKTQDYKALLHPGLFAGA